MKMTVPSCWLAKSLLGCGLLLSCWLLVGCDQGSAPATAVAEFEPNRVLAYNIGRESEQLMEQAIEESSAALEVLFGSPDDPRVPDFISEDEQLSSLVDIEKLRLAAGPVGTGGLYRQHCSTCHGVTGHGRGPTAALVDPYPRDYRLGKFKFKSTPVGSKPTKADLAYLIKHGIPGSSMVPIPQLNDEDIAALVDYVIYLSWRGEVERSMLLEAGLLYYSDGEVLYDPSLADSDPELFEEKWELIQEFTVDVATSWADADSQQLEVPKRDPSVVPDSVEQVLAAMAAPEDSPIKQSVARGQQLFVSEKTSCSKCHGPQGRGDGQANDYDEWTKDWTKKYGVNPEDESAHIPLIARGALPVRKVSPRNFETGVYRGGPRPEQLYQRIALGIDGTPMPAASVEPEAIWDLVNFVRSLVVPTKESAVDTTTAVADATAR